MLFSRLCLVLQALDWKVYPFYVNQYAAHSKTTVITFVKDSDQKVSKIIIFATNKLFHLDIYKFITDYLTVIWKINNEDVFIQPFPDFWVIHKGVFGKTYTMNWDDEIGVQIALESMGNEKIVCILLDYLSEKCLTKQ